MKRRKILIVKENGEYCKELEAFFANTGIFDVLPSANDGAAAVERFAEACPDILLMDVVLPRIDGIGVLRMLRAQRALEDTKTIMMSAFVDDNILGVLQELGAAYVIHMPASPAVVLGRVIDFAVQDDEARGMERSAKKRDMRLECDEIVTNYLHAVGIPVNLSGYQQLKTAIAYCIDNHGKRIDLTTDVYEHVARTHGTTAKRVERNIRTAIEAAWERGDIEWQHKLFGYTVHQVKGRPTNKEFVAMIADRTVMRMRHS